MDTAMGATEAMDMDTMARGPLRLPLLLPLRLLLLPRPITDTEDTDTLDTGTDTAMGATVATAMDTMARGLLRLLLLQLLRLLLLPRPITDTDTEVTAMATVMDTVMDMDTAVATDTMDKKELDDVKNSVGQIMKWFCLILVMITPCNLLNK